MAREILITEELDVQRNLALDNPTDEFIRCFEALKTEVNRRAGRSNSYAFEVEAASDRDGYVRRHRRTLIYIRDIRNALQHPQHHSVGTAIEVSSSFLGECRELLDSLRTPRTANKLGVKKSEILTAKLKDTLGDLAQEMRKSGFSHLPILDNDHAVIGVFNEAAVFDHLWLEEETIIGQSMTVADIIDHCSLNANHTETFRFINPRTSIDEVISIFVDLQSPTTRVGAIFVTASGKPNEPLQRLLTPWDVLHHNSS